MKLGKIAIGLAVCLPMLACTTQKISIRLLPQEKIETIAGLTVCDDAQEVFDIDTRRPMTIFVHGCNSSGGKDFRALAQVFEFHGHQTICFNYNDRDSLEESSAQLITALNQLTKRMDAKRVTILGHSQGGLVARRALIDNRADGLKLATDGRYRLITISSPFAGINASEDCGKTYLHFVTLGITVGVCHMISGAKWDEIYPGSDFMNYPGQLMRNVRYYLKIVTDERDSCALYENNGICIKNDYTFSLREQYHQIIDSDNRLSNIEIKAGHVEIVGTQNVAPKKLIAVLQSKKILNKTQSSRKNDLETLLSLLY